jgi:hypothetical protein
VLTEEGSEALLEPGAFAANGVFLQAVKGKLDLASPPFTSVALDQVREREAVGELAVFALAQEILDGVGVLSGGEVEDRARDGGDRDPFLDVTSSAGRCE